MTVPEQDPAALLPQVLAYGSKRSVRAGESIDFHVSTEAATYRADIVRLTRPDVGPLGRPFVEQVVEAGQLTGVHAGTPQEILPGSCFDVPGPLPLDGAVCVEIGVWPSLPEQAARTLIHLAGEAGSSLRLRWRQDQLSATLDIDGLELATLRCVAPPVREWSTIRVWLTIDGQMGLDWALVDAPEVQRETATTSSRSVSFGPATLLIASTRREDGKHDPGQCFNGRVEHVRLLGDREGSVVLAHWDFSTDMSSSTVIDRVAGHPGRLVNMPTRACRGSRWTARTLAWTADPATYCAAHFHDDDLADVAWERSLTFTAPTDLPSGCYALKVRPESEAGPAFHVPFAVRPAPGSATAPVAFVLPTTTYAAYANLRMRVDGQFVEMLHGRVTALDGTDLLLLSEPRLGCSTYDVHRDGSPVVYSTMNRPVTNFRPTGRLYKFCLDLLIVDWLDAQGIAADIITDDDIHAEGWAALHPYSVVITSSHPEYITHRQRDAFDSYVGHGGRLMYLGGNGFYSAAAISQEHPDTVEVRRPGQDNLWRVDHTEGTFSFDGSPGGLWRNIGHPEHSLTGVGFLTQGFDVCSGYRRTEAGRSPEFGWVFRGLEPNEEIGDFGILQGGAAGYEIDRHDVAKGSPADATVIASSHDHSSLYALMVPSILDTLPAEGVAPDPIRADMTVRRLRGGGAVFSVGSIAWAGSLSHNDYDNNVSTITRNVLERFLHSDPLV